MKALVTGAGGQLATALVTNVPNGVSVSALSRADLDITDKQLTMTRVGELCPDIIINTAAFTAVDRAESDSDDAGAINCHGARHLAEAAEQNRCRLIHISTDFVFDGQSEQPYRPDAVASPISRYGQSKLDGERAVREVLGESAVIIRSSWLYSRFGKNFVTTMLELMRSRESISVVNDQYGSPTLADSLSDIVYRVADDRDLGGTLHWSDAGVCSWYEFAVSIQEEAFRADLLESCIPINPCSSNEFGAAAPRPRFSALDISETEQVLGVTATHWRENLCRLLQAEARA